MDERKRFEYQGKEFEEDELVLVNGTELMYFITAWTCGDDAYFLAYYVEYSNNPVMQYRQADDYCDYAMRTFSKKDGDTIEKARAEEHQIIEEPVVYAEYKPYDYLIDGWVITIILMFFSLALKPVGAWPIAILVFWLILRRVEINRCNRVVCVKKDKK